MVRLVSWNVKGLCSPYKRIRVLRHLKKLKTNIAMLQETHLPAHGFHRMCKLWVGEVVGSPAIDRKAGILILL